jgi:hypothetical protein
MLFACAVSATRSTTRAKCQLSRPGIAVVVAVGLPEAGLVIERQREAAHPLRALPEVQMRDQEPRRAAVLGVQRLAIVLVDDPGLALGDVLERKVGRVAAVAPSRDVLGRRIDVFEQRVHRDAPPAGVQLRPLRHAVDVDGRRLLGQGEKLVPRPGSSAVHRAVDREGPLFKRRVRRRACRQDREVARQVLAGRDAGGIADLAPAPGEAAGDVGRQVVAHGPPRSQPPRRVAPATPGPTPWSSGVVTGADSTAYRRRPGAHTLQSAWSFAQTSST